MIGYVDVITGYEINVGFFYVLPVMIVTWQIGWRSGILLSVVCVVGMFIVDGFVTRDIEFPSNHLIPYWNTGIRLGYFIVITSILAALKRAHERERRRASQDALTCLANGETFANLARLEIAHARRRRRPISIAYLDCDDFKQVNDRLGHATGNELLKVVAATLIERLRESDSAARLGGDEFAILLPGASPESAKEVIQALRSELLDRMKNHGWPVTFSIGLATFVVSPNSLEEAMRESDSLMYDVKRSGKNLVSQRIFD